MACNERRVSAACPNAAAQQVGDQVGFARGAAAAAGLMTPGLEEECQRAGCTVVEVGSPGLKWLQFDGVKSPG